MSDLRKPPLFDAAPVRECSRWLGERNCGKTPTHHVDWGESWGFVCAEHFDELGNPWLFDRVHKLGSDCGMPGAYWDLTANVCRCDDSLTEPVLDEPRAEREPVGAPA